MECIWFVEGEHTTSKYGSSVVSLDYNADGHDDLVVLSSQFNHPGAGGNNPYHKGKLYFYYGSPNFANEHQPDLTLLRSSIEDSLNAILYLTTADLNGDGLKDLVCYKRANTGLQLYSGISVFYSGADCDTIPDFNYSFYDEYCIDGTDTGHMWQPIGDVNGDGCEDLGFAYVNCPYPNPLSICQFYILYGDPVSPHLEYLATWCTNVPFIEPRIIEIGNINNDAYDDFMITYYNEDLNKSVNAVIYGNTVIDTLITASQIINIPYQPSALGGAYCGDINGDGADDFIGDWWGYLNPKIWYGGNFNFNQPSFILDGQCYYGQGFSYGDINNDGFDDIIFGNMNMINDYGNLWIYLGSALPNSSCDLIVRPPFYVNPSAKFGNSTATGDFNCDGVTDIAIGAPCEGSSNSDYGFAFVFAGNTNILETTVATDDLPESVSNVIFKAYPNPFNPNVNFEIKTDELDQNLQIDIFNVKGQKIETLRLNTEQQKNGNIQWNSDHLSSGIYICQLRSEQKLLSSRKISLIK